MLLNGAFWVPYRRHLFVSHNGSSIIAENGKNGSLTNAERRKNGSLTNAERCKNGSLVNAEQHALSAKFVQNPFVYRHTVQPQ